jgi:isopentenyl-diphosphate delta-isomerase
MGDIVDRKREHIAICLEEEVESGRAPGLGRWRLDYQALPEMKLEDVDLRTHLLGRDLAAPLLIGAMTGGTEEAGRINRILAEAAQRCGVGLAMGSGRVALERPETMPSFQVRDVAPDVLIFANLGAVQFNYGLGAEDANTLVSQMGADALNLHLNPLQEAIQPEGDTDFSGLHERLTKVVPEIHVPVIIKEVGAGIGASTAKRLSELPIAGLETAGVGGTSWARVEALRHDDADAHYAGQSLAGFGVPTAESILGCRAALGPHRIVIASGGVRHAEHMGTALGLGADAVACARPFLEASQDGVDAVAALIDHLIHTLRILHFTCGARTPSELRGRVVEASG